MEEKIALHHEISTWSTGSDAEVFGLARVKVWFETPNSAIRYIEFAFQCSRLSDDEQDKGRYQTHIQPSTGPRPFGYWYAATVKADWTSGYTGGIQTENLIRLAALAKRLDKVITKYNLGYKYPQDDLCQLVAALVKVGSVQVEQVNYQYEPVPSYAVKLADGR